MPHGQPFCPSAHWHTEYAHLGGAAAKSPSAARWGKPVRIRRCRATVMRARGSTRSRASQVTHPRSVTFPSRQLGADTSTAAGRRREILMTWIPHDLAVSMNVSPVWPAILRAFFVRSEEMQ